MDRRNFVKAVLATGVAGAVAPKAIGDTGGRSYESKTISVQMVEEQPGLTSVLLFEHGDADYVIVEAFYWGTLNGLRLLLHKEAATPVGKEAGSAADLPLALADIIFIKVYELKLLSQSEFGKVPHGS